MPTVPINYLAVVVAAVASTALGALWYSPLLFGKQWMALSGMSPEVLDAAKNRGMGKLYAIAFVGSLAMSYVLAHALVFASAYMAVSGISAGLTTGFWNWLGFVAPVTLGSVLWDNKPWGLRVLKHGHYLLSLIIMGVILALW